MDARSQALRPGRRSRTRVSGHDGNKTLRSPFQTPETAAQAPIAALLSRWPRGRTRMAATARPGRPIAAAVRGEAREATFVGPQARAGEEAVLDAVTHQLL